VKNVDSSGWLPATQWSLGLLAALVVLLNSVKPLCVDDFVFSEYSHHIAQRPMQPYGFETTFAHDVCPAIYVLNPPTFLYWWSLGIHLFGESPVAWKLWTFPIVLAGTLAFHSIARRLMNSETAFGLTWLAFFSPALLPSINMMLDVPALSLGWLALSLFMAGLDRGSFSLVVVSGVTCAFAMQTKYTSFTIPIAILLWGLHQGEFRRALLSASLAGLLFISWECLIAYQEGQSHFMCIFGQRSGGFIKRCIHLVVPHATQLGALSLPVVLMMLDGLWRRRWLTLAWGGTYAGLLAFTLLAPKPWQVMMADEQGVPKLEVLNIVFTVNGFSTVLLGSLAILRIWSPARLWQLLQGKAQRISIEDFLVGWLMVEIACAFAISPFAAARRVFGVLFVVMLMAGRLLAQSRAPIPNAAWALGLLLACSYFGVDYLEASAARSCLQQACDRVDVMATPESRRIFIATYGARYYAEVRDGWQPMLNRRTQFREGDFVVVLHNNGYDPPIDWQGHSIAKLQDFVKDDGIPWTTWGGFYSGTTPIKSKRGPRSWSSAYLVGRKTVLARSESVKN
jgi:hypothetical protein